MKQPPTPRPHVYDLYWYFAAERQQIFEKRARGQAGPWTDDPILQRFKFCNTFRAADRVSQYLIREICYPKTLCSRDDQLFQIVTFRLFSKIETWNSMCNFLGRAPIISDLINGVLRVALEHAEDENHGLYTSAFILCATNAYGQPRKYLTHIELLRDMFIGSTLASKIRNARSLQEIVSLIHSYPLMGDFMSYQIAIDLNYSDQINFSENDFTQAGPGALRGINKVFENLGDYTPEETIMWMVDHQTNEFTRLGLTFHGLFGRPLHAIDCQSLFCETDKYCREAAPELASARSRIKTKFTQSNTPMALFFPPKWQIATTLPTLK